MKQENNFSISRKPLSGICSYDKRQTPDKNARGINKGFTLIELLVVVLIIGILAAVALPQYQKAVEKSKATQALTLLKSVYNAAKAYQLANGSWPTDFDSLAVEIPFTGTVNGINIGHRRPGKSNSDWSIQLEAPLNTESTLNASGVFISRISGPYTGAVFFIYADPPTDYPNMPKDQICCKEAKKAVDYESTMLFTKSKGAYCKQIMKGTFISTPAVDHVFILP